MNAMKVRMASLRGERMSMVCMSAIVGYLVGKGGRSRSEQCADFTNRHASVEEVGSS